MNTNRQLELDYVLKNRDLINYKNLSEIIHEKRFTVKDVSLHYRWIRYWYQKGVLLKNYEEGKWKKFDLVEYVWLRMIMLMRKFNISLDRIKEVKRALIQEIPASEILKDDKIIDNIMKLAEDKDRDKVAEVLGSKEFHERIQLESINLFETLIMHIITFQSSFSIIITEDNVIPFNHSLFENPEYKQGFNDLMKESFIAISVSEILRDYMIKISDIKEKNRLALLTEDEEKVLDVLREDKLKSVIIKYGEDKKIDLIETIRVEKVDKRARLMDFIMTNGYQDITIKTQNGEIVYCENKRKRQVNDKL